MLCFSSELVKCPPGLVAPKATLTCNKTGKKESCSLTCASKAHYLAGRPPAVGTKRLDREIPKVQLKVTSVVCVFRVRQQLLCQLRHPHPQRQISSKAQFKQQPGLHRSASPRVLLSELARLCAPTGRPCASTHCAVFVCRDSGPSSEADGFFQD